MSSRADNLARLAEAISTSKSSYSQSHIQGEPLLYPASTTLQLPPCEHTGPNTPLRQSTHRTGAPMKTVAEVKAQLELELFDGKKPLQVAPASADSVYRDIKGLTDTSIKRYLKKTSHYDTDANRWTGIPKTGPEDGLYLPFTKIMNDVLGHFGLDHAKVEDTHKEKLTCLEEHQMKYVDENEKEILTKTSPDICIMGAGNKFRRKEPGPPSYFHCVGPVELKTEKLLHNVGLRQVVLQVAVYVRQCFDHQPNRRFACAIMATEENFRLMVFDRLGGMQTGSFNIHAHAKAFVRVIVGIANYTDADFSCFDTAISWLPCGSCVTQYLHLKIMSCFEVAKDDRGKRDLEIVLNNKPFARRAIRGRGTRCWLGVILSGRDRTPVVVKESWRSKGRNAEWILLKKVAHFDGVGKMLYYCDTEEDTISRFRALIFGDIDPNGDSFDRIFSRVVLEAYGPPIHYFQTPLRLLQVLRDAIAGHSFMWKAGILHRDISIHNIVHGKENATNGNSGVLIDLDMAIDIMNYEKNAESRTGTRAFQSIMVVSPFIQGRLRPPQDHLDDLESFFYVLLWICMLFVAPNKMAIRNEYSRVHRMEVAQSDVCADNKRLLLSSPTEDFAPWFATNTIFCDLVDSLAASLKKEVDTKFKIIKEHEYRPEVEFPEVTQIHKNVGTNHHEVFLKYFDAAIEKLQSDDSKGPDPEMYQRGQHSDVLELDASAAVIPSVLETGTTYGNVLKRERSASDGDAGTAKRAATSATVGISHLQISDSDTDEGTN